MLEIGCGPSGIIFSIDIANKRIGIEPLEISDLLKDSKKKAIINKGTGEELQFPDNYFDSIFCFNVLDRTVDPSKVFKESYRVLKKGGEFFLWIHVLKQKYRFLTPLLDKIDRPHPYHFTTSDIVNLCKNTEFRITYKKIFSGLGPSVTSEIILPNINIKTRIGEMMMYDLWIRLIR